MNKEQEASHWGAMKSFGFRSLAACLLRRVSFLLLRWRQALARLQIRCLLAKDLEKQPFRGTASTVGFMFRSTAARRCCSQAHLAARRKRIGLKSVRITNFGFMTQVTKSFWQK